MNILFLGIGGTGMRGLAYLLEQRGEIIVGYDDNPDTTKCSYDDALSALKTATRLVYTDAAQEDHALRIAARAQGVKEIPYQKALGEFSAKYTTIAVTGTHGKSSTTALLAHIAITAGLDPTVLIGANMPTLPGGHARLGKSKYFIVEADEYRRHFLELTPTHIVITSIDFDHPDAFSSLEDTEHAYSEFIALLQPGGRVIVPLQEQQEHPNILWPTHARTIAEDLSQDVSIALLPGRHMRMNAVLACEAATVLGINRDAARKALLSFAGISRRFELLGVYEGIEIRSDYGHHPTEIAATIAGAREVHPHSHITAIFEAHMPLRLHTFFDAFASSLATADSILIVPPFIPAGRDAADATRDAVRLSDTIATRGKHVTYVTDIAKLPSMIVREKSYANTPIIVIGFSAGTLDSQLRKIVNKS